MQSEAIYQALFDRLKGIDGIVTASRRLRHFNQVPSEQRPALFVTQGNQLEVPVKGLNAKIELEASVYIYIHESDPAIAPSTRLNLLVDLVREAIKPDFPEVCEYQQLGGLVEHCWVDGTIEVFEAVENLLDDQGIAIIPIRILTTN
ncbi:hypothetical protein [Acinetobacter rudis]|uniref:hypothetical protein n=1 Tax=Acinetobacter rudis TaxID=632955 RepID=UPI003340BD01